MIEILNLKTISDNRGNLTVIDRELPFSIARIFYIYGVNDSVRGGHRHYKTRQAAICIQGECTIYNNDGTDEIDVILDSPDKCLLIEPNNWHRMYNFSKDAILLVLASEPFLANDYIYEPYENSIRRSKES